jgi:hypothetical protein
VSRQFAGNSDSSGVKAGTVGWARTTDLLFHRQLLIEG